VGVATTGGTVRIYDIRAMKLQQLYSAHEGAATSLSFHPSGNFLASGAGDSKVKIYDLLQTCTLYTLSGHQGPINSVAFSPRGDFLSSGGQDKQLMVWKINLESTRETAVRSEIRGMSSLQVDQSGVSAPLRNLAQEFKSREPEENREHRKRGGEDEKENRGPIVEENSSGLEKVVNQLAAMNTKLNTLTQTVLLVEKRIGLVEEQVRLLSRK